MFSLGGKVRGPVINYQGVLSLSRESQNVDPYLRKPEKQKQGSVVLQLVTGPGGGDQTEGGRPKVERKVTNYIPTLKRAQGEQYGQSIVQNMTEYEGVRQDCRRRTD